MAVRIDSATERMAKALQEMEDEKDTHGTGALKRLVCRSLQHR